MSDPVVHINKIVMVDVADLRPHPDNPNDHTDKQVKRLAQIIAYQGWRQAIKVSNRSGYITAGHGRLLAAQLMGWPQVPVSYQDYADEEMEYADVVADNAVALWSEINKAKVNEKLADLDGANFDLDMLGMDDFKLDISEMDLKDPNASEEYMRTISLMYTPDIYDHVMLQMDKLMDKHGIEDPSALIAHLLDINL